MYSNEDCRIAFVEGGEIMLKQISDTHSGYGGSSCEMTAPSG